MNSENTSELIRASKFLKNVEKRNVKIRSGNDEQDEGEKYEKKRNENTKELK